jgi:NAD-dependent dihydropyrimidine dehydrogenase PreA subunit
MPLPLQADPYAVQHILQVVLNQARPPVARCRLLSSGFGPGHMLNIEQDISGTRACLGCGSCIDACPVLSREPGRRLRSPSRTSLALETMVAEDCDRCCSCVLACPQVDTTIKHFVVQNHLAEGMAALLAGATCDELLALDLIWADGSTI